MCGWTGKVRVEGRGGKGVLAERRGDEFFVMFGLEYFFDHGGFRFTAE